MAVKPAARAGGGSLCPLLDSSSGSGVWLPGVINGMQTNVYLPQLELTMAEVTVATIHVAVGDLVAEEQPLIDVETEKALVPVPAPKGGFVRFLFVKAAEQLAENALLCILTDTPNEP